jgi:Nucleotidyltransferase domain
VDRSLSHYIEEGGTNDLSWYPRMKTERQLPPHVRAVAAALESELHAQEVWLIGSQVNGSATPSSDWDLLLFSSQEPEPTEARCLDVDVIHVGPSGLYLLEGQPRSMTLPFASFKWHQDSYETATYTALRLPCVKEGVAQDSSEPSYTLKECCAELVWKRN